MLACIPGISYASAQSLVAPASQSGTLNSIAWVTEVLDQTSATRRAVPTGKSYHFRRIFRSWFHYGRGLQAREIYFSTRARGSSADYLPAGFDGTWVGRSQERASGAANSRDELR